MRLCSGRGNGLSSLSFEHKGCNSYCGCGGVLLSWSKALLVKTRQRSNHATFVVRFGLSGRDFFRDILWIANWIIAHFLWSVYVCFAIALFIVYELIGLSVVCYLPPFSLASCLLKQERSSTLLPWPLPLWAKRSPLQIKGGCSHTPDCASDALWRCRVCKSPLSTNLILYIGICFAVGDTVPYKTGECNVGVWRRCTTRKYCKWQMTLASLSPDAI